MIIYKIYVEYNNKVYASTENNVAYFATDEITAPTVEMTSGTLQTKDTLSATYHIYNDIIYMKLSNDWYVVNGVGVNDRGWYGVVGSLITDPDTIALIEDADSFEFTVYKNATFVEDVYDKPLIYNAELDTIEKSLGSIEVVGNLKASNTAITGDLSVTGDITATNLSFDAAVVDSDVTIGGDLSVTGDITTTDITAETGTFNDNVTIDGALSATGDLSIGGQATINGDLYVNGKTHSIETEEVVATGDILTLRANNTSPLSAGQVSGIVVNKYNGTDDLAFVTDNDGTLRVGTGTGTDTTYNKVALKSSDGQYYTYDDTAEPITYTLMSPQPSGTMTGWTGKQTTTNYTLWATATFTVVDKTSLVPMLGRDEDINLNDGALLKWDATTWTAKTINNPTADGQLLQSSIQSTTTTTDVYTDGTTFYDVNGDVTTEPSGTAGTPTVIGSYVLYNGVWYFNNTDWYSITDFTDTTGTLVTDQDTIDALDAETPIVVSRTTYTETTVTSSIIDWVTPTVAPRNFVYNTMAEYTADAANVPEGSSVIILNETSYVKADIQ